MTTPSDTLLICLRIKGFGKAEALAEALGEAPEAAGSMLAELTARGLAAETRAGARLTPEGRAIADAALAHERASLDADAMARCHGAFVPVNQAFKELVTRWQMRTIDGRQVRNDHADAQYDRAVLDGLRPIHDSVVGAIETAAATAPRLGGYSRRLAAALAKVEAGDHRYITAPDRDSYHTVWFELHQDLIGLTGTTREKEAAAGRAV